LTVTEKGKCVISNQQTNEFKVVKIIFFDGNCPMCHSWVKRIIQWDKNKTIRFAPLESDVAKNILAPVLPDYLKEDTIVFYDEGSIFMRSDAALKIVGQLGLPYNLGVIGKILPKKLRYTIYKMVASKRYKFGKRYESCPLPPEEWRDRFLS